MIRDLGIGLVFLPGLESLVESFSDVIDVIEVEPQTLWYKKSSEDDLFFSNQNTNDWLIQQNKPIIFHSVSLPVGGSLPQEAGELNSLIKHKDILNPVYCSEHLSFNRRKNKCKTQNLNFLLPPLQTFEGINHAVTNIKYLQQQLLCPLAIETGTNYFQPMKWELPDGYFMAEVVKKSDCNILLDLHNLMTNEKNGRQKVMDFISMLPKEKIIEIHLSGGYEEDGMYIDAHSHTSSEEVWNLAREIVPMLPNLKCIIFEMIPEYLNHTISTDDLKKQFANMKEVWHQTGKKIDLKKPVYYIPQDMSISCSSDEWENVIGDVIENQNDTKLPECLLWLKEEKGISLLQDMVFQIRISSISSALKITSQYILVVFGSTYYEDLIRKFILTNDVKMYGFANGLQFAAFLRSEKIKLTYLEEIINFEIASLKAAMSGKNRKYTLPFPPATFLEDIIEGRIPLFENKNNEVFEIDLLPENTKTTHPEINQYEMEYHS